MSMIEIDNVFLKGQTDLAAFCVIDGKEYCLPWSQIDEGSEIAATGDTGTIWIPLWLAQEKGLDR